MNFNKFGLSVPLIAAVAFGFAVTGVAATERVAAKDELLLLDNKKATGNVWLI